MADTAAQKACSYILNRIQTDPDLRYYAGPLTETFHLLCVAQAEYTGQPLAEIEEQRAKDLQPEYRKRRAEVHVLQSRIQELETRLIPEGERRKLTGDAPHAEGPLAAAEKRAADLMGALRRHGRYVALALRSETAGMRIGRDTANWLLQTFLHVGQLVGWLPAPLAGHGTQVDEFFAALEAGTDPSGRPMITETVRPAAYVSSDPWSLLRMALDYFDHPAGDCSCGMADSCPAENFAGFLSVCRTALRRYADGEASSSLAGALTELWDLLGSGNWEDTRRAHEILEPALRAAGRLP